MQMILRNKNLQESTKDSRICCICITGKKPTSENLQSPFNMGYGTNVSFSTVNSNTNRYSKLYRNHFEKKRNFFRILGKMMSVGEKTTFNNN